uniref:Uncharacterized protein n=1 Tax=Pseudomonas marincola TaxID=437900 RepID=A0A653E6H2_9PSED
MDAALLSVAHPVLLRRWLAGYAAQFADLRLQVLSIGVLWFDRVACNQGDP